jgi:Family of unknown function (DUF5946)
MSTRDGLTARSTTPPPAACPGCGLVLPGGHRDPAGHINASGACQAVHDRVAAFEAEHLSLGRFRQMRVDVYGAQHAGSPTPPVRVIYGLVGLHLALDSCLSGDGVRQAHSLMGKPGADWLRFEISPRADLTVLDAAAAGADGGSAPGHAEGMLRWGRSVWSSWAAAHESIAEFTGRLFTGNERFWGWTDTYRP